MDDQELDLRHSLRVLRRRAPIIAMVVIFAVGSAVAFTVLSTRVYAATATLQLGSASSQFTLSGVPIAPSPAEIATQVEILQSRQLGQQVARQLGRRSSKLRTVSAANVADTNLATITVKSTDARLAPRAANLYATTFARSRREQAVNELLAASDIVSSKLAEIEARLASLQTQIDAAGLNPPAELRAERDSASAQAQSYREKLDQLQVDAALRNGGAQLVERAIEPSEPVEPKPVRDIGLAALLGLILGIAAAYLAEFLDDKMRTPDEVARYGRGLTVLTEIPTVPGWRDRRSARIASLIDPGSITAEAYRSLRTSIQLIALKKPLQSLLVTSPLASEGKTTTAVNLGVTIARTGRRVVVVDLDFRRPRVASFFGVNPLIGVTSVLVGDAPLSGAIHEVPISPDVPPLAVLPSGPLPSNPSELLGTPRVAEFLALLQSAADLLIVDSPPLLPVTDALVLSHQVDGVIVVVGTGQTRRRHLDAAMELLQKAEAPILGGVLNASSGNAGRRYGYTRSVRTTYSASDGHRKRARETASR